MREVNVKITCDATGEEVDAVERDPALADELFPVEELLDAPDGWLAVAVVRVRPNPAAGAKRELPPIPSNPADLEPWLESLRASEEDVAPYFVDQAIFHVAPGQARALDQALPGCFDGAPGFEDLT